MNASAMGKRINYIFAFTLLSVFFKLGVNLFSANFSGISLLDLIVLAEGVMFWLAFKSDSLEKALNQLSVLKIFSLITAAYAAYDVVMQIVRIQRYGLYLEVLELWFLMSAWALAILSSLAIFFTAITLSVGNTKKFNIASAVILIIEAFVLLGAVVALAVEGILGPVIMGLVMAIVLFTAVPKLLGNKIIKGAIVGGIIAGDVGAVVGAIVASKSDKK